MFLNPSIHPTQFPMIEKDVLLNTPPQTGRVEYLSIRPVKGAPVQPVRSVMADTERGIADDHYNGESGKRQVTLMQFEHLEVVRNILDLAAFPPSLTRRNITVSGINLLAFEGRRFRIGAAILEMTGPCHPCSRMEENLGPGGYNALRGHGGITARVIQGGAICLGDSVALLFENN